MEPKYINILFRDYYKPLLIEALRGRSETLIISILNIDANLELRSR